MARMDRFWPFAYSGSDHQSRPLSCPMPADGPSIWQAERTGLQIEMDRVSGTVLPAHEILWSSGGACAAIASIQARGWP